MAELSGLTIAVVGGDEREQQIATLAAAAGARVRAHGFTAPKASLAGVLWCDSPAEAVDQANYLLLPIPGIAADGSLFAPDAPAPIIADDTLLAGLAPGAAVVLGQAGPILRAAAEGRGIDLLEYETDVELMLDRGPAIVEGLLGVIIANTAVTIHRAQVVVIGHGTIGRLLVRTLVLLGARVTLAARNPVQRADARTSGADTVDLAGLAEVLPSTDIVLSTVPSRVLSAELLARMPSGALVVDVAAPPGGIDLAAAKDLGLSAVWARGMGRRAPITVGSSQWRGIERRIIEREESRRVG